MGNLIYKAGKFSVYYRLVNSGVFICSRSLHNYFEFPDKDEIYFIFSKRRSGTAYYIPETRFPRFLPGTSAFIKKHVEDGFCNVRLEY